VVLEEEAPSWRRILLSGGRVSRALSRGRVSSKEMQGTSSPCPEARHLSEKEKARHPPGRESANSTLLETRSDSLKTHSKEKSRSQAETSWPDATCSIEVSPMPVVVMRRVSRVDCE